MKDSALVVLFIAMVLIAAVGYLAYQHSGEGTGLTTTNPSTSTTTSIPIVNESEGIFPPSGVPGFSTSGGLCGGIARLTFTSMSTNYVSGMLQNNLSTGYTYNPEATDYILAPGNVGIINYTVSYHCSSAQPCNSSLSHANITNQLLLFHGSYSNASTPGINISISPQEETLAFNQTATFTARINASENAAEGTYYMESMSCGYGVLLTIGNRSYSGPIPNEIIPV